MAEKTIVNDSPRKRKKGDVIEFKNKGTYYFTVTRDMTVSHNRIKKRVLLGQFLSVGEYKNDSAPENCHLDTDYCLKSAKVTLDMLLSEHPQNREYLDFLNYKGDNLRSILAVNKDTLALWDFINSPQISSATAETVLDCAVIEPYYKPFDMALFDSNEKKLCCLAQVVDGLYQLYGCSFNAIKSIIAHRDLKFSNIVIDKTQDKADIKLIDFSSIKTDFMLDHYNKLSKGALSPSNTAPEDVMEEYAVSEKNDVFALGIMLAEIFGIFDDGENRNPLSMLFDNAGIDLSDTKSVAEFYREIIDVSSYGQNPHWLENALPSSADWSVENTLTGIKQLFEASTRLIPDDRITLCEFEDGLYGLLKKAQKSITYPESYTVFLISKDGIEENKNSYIKTACEIMKSQNVCPVIIEYSSKSGIVINANNMAVSLCDSEIISTPLALKHHIRAIKQGAFGYSELCGAIYCAYENLNNISLGASFNGEFHIFAKEAPTNDNCCVLHFDGEKTLDIETLLDSHRELKIIIHTNGKDD